MMRWKWQTYYRQSGPATWQTTAVPEPGENRACPAQKALSARPLSGGAHLNKSINREWLSWHFELWGRGVVIQNPGFFCDNKIPGQRETVFFYEREGGPV